MEWTLTFVCFLCRRKLIIKLADQRHLLIIIGKLVNQAHLHVSSIMQSVVIRNVIFFVIWNIGLQCVQVTAEWSLSFDTFCLLLFMPNLMSDINEITDIKSHNLLKCDRYDIIYTTNNPINPIIYGNEVIIQSVDFQKVLMGQAFISSW